MPSTASNTTEDTTKNIAAKNAKSATATMPNSHRLMHLGMMLLSLLWILPMLVVISASLTDEKALAQHGFGLIPSVFSLAAYQFLLRDPSQLLQAYGVSLLVTFFGALTGLLVMSLLAYPLSRQEFRYRNPISFMVFFTMLFNGGLVASYIINTRYLGLTDSILALILPSLVIAFNVLLLRTYFASLPTEIIEAARIDGASEWLIFFRIVLPLSTPALATVGLFLVLMFWNDYFLALIYINSSEKQPLQLLLFNILNNVEVVQRLQSQGAQQINAEFPTQSVRMAMAVLATGPIAFAFLYLQRFFVQGLTVGSLKG
jgi:putative aldouronate transport system permease protein